MPSFKVTGTLNKTGTTLALDITTGPVWVDGRLKDGTVHDW